MAQERKLTPKLSTGSDQGHMTRRMRTLTEYAVHKVKAAPSLEVLWISNGDAQATLRRQVTADQGAMIWAGKSQVKVCYGFGRTAELEVQAKGGRIEKPWALVVQVIHETIHIGAQADGEARKRFMKGSGCTTGAKQTHLYVMRPAHTHPLKRFVSL